MSRVEEIESQIEQLPPEEFARVANWIREMDQQRWDEQLDRDAAAGKLDALLAEARAERESGLLRDWPAAE
jgi:hypothetical protein